MGAQYFSKYLPFPLYCGRLMAFDVGGRLMESGGTEAQGVGMEGWIIRIEKLHRT